VGLAIRTMGCSESGRVHALEGIHFRRFTAHSFKLACGAHPLIRAHTNAHAIAMTRRVVPLRHRAHPGPPRRGAVIHSVLTLRVYGSDANASCVSIGAVQGRLTCRVSRRGRTLGNAVSHSLRCADGVECRGQTPGIGRLAADKCGADSGRDLWASTRKVRWHVVRVALTTAAGLWFLTRAVAESANSAGRKIAMCYTSPLGRAHTTALIISKHLPGVKVHVDKGLRERSFGCLEGLDSSTAQRQFPEAWARNRSREDDYVPPGGESRRDARTRALAALQDIAQKHAGERVLILTHSALLSTLLVGVLDMVSVILLCIHAKHCGVESERGRRCACECSKIFTLKTAASSGARARQTRH
jgi:hypothetical protein